MLKKPYGSGYFGEWIQDQFGLPAYRYTCDQINDSKAITPMNEVWRPNTDHMHLVGNDRLAGIASNYGYVQVRQDEGSPKYLNEYDPKHKQYAGGFGYLTDGKDFISTYYTGNEESFDRIFGIGYYRKKVTGKGLTADQVIFAPFGDDPLLLSQITITNNRKESANLRWIEYWGCYTYQFSINAYISAIIKKNMDIVRNLRRELSEKFTNEFKLLEKNEGLIQTKYYLGRKDIKKKSILKPVFEDKNPPDIFLVSLDSASSGINTNGNKFFGEGSVEFPDGLKFPLNFDVSAVDSESAMFIEREIQLEPNESQTLYFAYGYLPEGYELDPLIEKYKEKDLSKILLNSCESWKNNRIELKISKEPWVDRELLWHNYYLRGSMTYDNFFKEHILSQGHVYQYIIGFQGATRDPMQHVMPFIYSQPKIVKEIIKYTLKTVDKEGKIPYGITGSGAILPVPIKPSDLEMWLLWLVSEYVLITRDKDILDEILPTYPLYGKKAGRASVRELLSRCYKHFVEISGPGEHGVQRLSNGDWNDGAVLGNVPENKHEEVREHGESVLNAAMASATLDIYAEMLYFIGDSESADKAAKYAASQREAVKAQWVGKWFRRAWLCKELGWIGEDQLWLEPQPWAIIAGATNNKQNAILVRSIDELVRKSSKIGARLVSKGIEAMKREKGMRVNGGIWPSINGTLIWALSLVNGDMAWDEWKKNSLGVHAESFPEVWYGIWSGPDVYNSNLSNYPGQTHFFSYILTKNPEDKKIMEEDPMGICWTDFPVMNLHVHAWPLYNTIHLMGIKANRDGIEYKPILPMDEYSFSSPLVGLKRSENGYSGWYSPITKTTGTWKFSLKVGEEEIKELKSIKINGKDERFTLKDNVITWSCKNTPDKPMQWVIGK